MNRFLLFLTFFFFIYFFSNSSILAQQPNILLVIADDIGIDPVPGYFPGPTKANMPNLTQLMEDGITFENAWANPVCSPTRASILTGKYGFRTNVLNPMDMAKLDTSEVVIHQYLEESTNGEYASSLIGKWHLNGSGNNAPRYPEFCGIPHFAGLVGGAVNDYYDWRLVTDGQGNTSNEYITSKFTDLAIDWISNQSQPWFCWVAYTAAHTPLHLPPDYMHAQGTLPTDSASIADNPLPYYLAMIESVDYELGRLLENIEDTELENTVVIFIGDNGTMRSVIQQPYNRSQSKGSLYQGGVHVPLVIAGAEVTRTMATEPALVNATDLYATIAELAGLELDHIHDSYSFKGLLSEEGAGRRNCIYSESQEHIDSSLAWTARNQNYKLIKWADGTEAFFDLSTDPYEDNDLLPIGLSPTAQISYNQLSDYFNSSCATPIISSVQSLTPTIKALSVFPNPAYDQVTLQREIEEPTPFIIYDLLGNVVHSGSFIGRQQLVDIKHFANGVYVIKVADEIVRFVKS